ncbi:hypothetical protein JTB14_034367 [Gonioctena quinquepunctata]|nr:hypothetical protein JTB14_034367 [Gonioctena quinquepunctata]
MKIEKKKDKSNIELKVPRTEALRQTAINRLTLISESAALAKTNSEDQNRFKVRHRDLKKVIKDFEKHHNTILTLLAEDEAKLKEEHEHDEEFVKQCQFAVNSTKGKCSFTPSILRFQKWERLPRIYVQNGLRSSCKRPQQPYETMNLNEVLHEGSEFQDEL